jgi:hypothetical protein
MSDGPLAGFSLLEQKDIVPSVFLILAYVSRRIHTARLHKRSGIECMDPAKLNTHMSLSDKPRKSSYVIDTSLARRFVGQAHMIGILGNAHGISSASVVFSQCQQGVDPHATEAP